MTKHKHYYAIRAFADGWKIQWKYAEGELWRSNKIGPTWNDPSLIVEVIPDSEGWLPYYPECPLPVADYEYQFNSGKKFTNPRLALIDWRDVSKYRQLKTVDPYAELKAAAKDPTKEISLKGVAKEILGWHSGDYWNFDLPPEAYEIRDKPKTRKVKYEAWESSSGQLLLYREGFIKALSYDGGKAWIRRPSEDKEVEVEE